MLVYQVPAGRAEPVLVKVRVFASAPPNDPRRAAADLAEINQLLRTGGQEGTARLADLRGAAPNPMVRIRAAAALGRTGGVGAEATLTGALNDQAAEVRVQAVDALRRVAGARAIRYFNVFSCATRTLRAGELRPAHSEWFAKLPPHRRSALRPRILTRPFARKSAWRSGATV